MELSLYKRETGKKSILNGIRRKGDIPSIIYSSDSKDCMGVYINGDDFSAALRKMDGGKIPTTVFSIKMDSESFKAIVKEIQYDKTSYKVIHVDFLRLADDREVVLSVPIELEGREECVGVKLGGALRQVVRYLKIKCLPKDIPASFKLNVSNLKMAQSLRLSDIEIKEGIVPLGRLGEVAVVIAKR